MSIAQKPPGRLARLKHLSARAGFGDGFYSEGPATEHTVLKNILAAGNYRPAPLEVAETAALQSLQQKGRKKMTPEEKKALRQLNRRGVARLNGAWLDEMVRTDHPFLEKMALFWHGHFACRINNVLFCQQLVNVIRRHALGNFRDLLFAVSKSPAMLQFLNNQQNRKKHPNENFAREVMELFTMGRGNYTEKDVKEGARGFTGWGYNSAGRFVFRKYQHDEGVKTFLGKTGRFNGEDLLDIILAHKATAYFLTRKLYAFFVNEQVPEAVLRPLAEGFYRSGYHIAGLMEAIFRSRDFYRRENLASRIKSPVELLVGLQRAIPVVFGEQKAPLLFQRLMGQVLFYPPNVGGWPGGRSWIDSATLVFRLRLPQIIFASGLVRAQPKAMPDELMEEQTEGAGYRMVDPYLKRYARKVRTTVRWKTYEDHFKNVPDEALPRAVSERLLTQTKNPKLELLRRYGASGSREARIRRLSIAVMSQPEYQLC